MQHWKSARSPESSHNRMEARCEALARKVLNPKSRRNGSPETSQVASGQGGPHGEVPHQIILPSRIRRTESMQTFNGQKKSLLAFAMLAVQAGCANPGAEDTGATQESVATVNGLT